MTILLVRHAHAGSRGSWVADDRLRPLSATGKGQADGLLEQFAGRPVDRIVSSPFLRCVQTVEPLGAERGVPVEQTEDLAEGYADRALDLVRALRSTAAVLCTHGDIIPAVLRAIDNDGGDIQGEWRWAKGSTWVLDADGSKIVTARYLQPTVK